MDSGGDPVPMMRTRPATVADAVAIAAIYTQGIEDRVATFETRPRTAADVIAWFDGPHPVIVVERVAPATHDGASPDAPGEAVGTGSDGSPAAGTPASPGEPVGTDPAGPGTIGFAGAPACHSGMLDRSPHPDRPTVVAFAATSGYRPRDCYAGIAEFSVYVERGSRGLGAGRLAMAALVEAATAAGFHKLVSRVFVENGASRALLRSAGFREVGTYERHARLDGAWRDVVIVERLLPDPADDQGTGRSHPPVT